MIASRTLYRERALTFDCAGESLVGILHEPSVWNGKPGIVIVVGGPQYRVGSHRQFVLMARELAAAGCPVLRFDYRGMGDSSGAQRKFDEVGFDIHAAIDVLMGANPGLRRVILWGLCDAASAALIYCTSDSRVAGLILANPWVFSPVSEAQSYLKHYYFRRLLQRSFWTKLLGLRVEVRSSATDFLQKIRQVLGKGSVPTSTVNEGGFLTRMLQGLQSFTGPVLVLLSERDLMAKQFQDLKEGVSGWRRAMDRTNVSVAELPNTDHTFSNREGLDEATRHCLAWVQQFGQESGSLHVNIPVREAMR